MKKSRLIFVFLIGWILIFSGCKKIEVTEPDNSALDEITVNESFDWKTSKSINLYLTGYASNLARIVSSTGSIYQTVFLNQNERMKVTISIPSYETNVRLLYMGQEIDVPITTTEIEYIFN